MLQPLTFVFLKFSYISTKYVTKLNSFQPGVACLYPLKNIGNSLD